MILLSMLAIAIIATAAVLIWFNYESSELQKLPHVVQPEPFEHSEEEAYNLKHAVVSLMVYGELPIDVVEEILGNVYGQKQLDFPESYECLVWLLISLFDFYDTPQGNEYWDNIDQQLDAKMPPSRDPRIEQWIKEALE